jgi:hypothetical protein
VRYNIWIKNTSEMQKTKTPLSSNLIKILLGIGYEILDSMIVEGKSD